MRKPIGLAQKLALLSFTIFVLLSLVLLGTRGTLGQSNFPAPRITQAINETKLVALRGNTHPLAQPQFDRGAVPASFPMEHMFLVLQCSADRETALEALLARQQDHNSPDFHRWLTPEEFGRQFGAADQDIQTIIAWLSGHDFHVNSASNGRTIIDFSGNAGLVASAFHTQIHHYAVPAINSSGAPAVEDHYANASDPMIPAALAPVVAGITHLTDFFPKPQGHFAGVVNYSKSAQRFERVKPQFTISSTGGTFYTVGPYDFAAIYDELPLWNASPAINGTGVTIAIAGDSNIHPSDDAAFRATFGLPAKAPTVIIPTGGTDAGVLCPSANDCPENEAILDVEWAGAAAPGAQIDLIEASDASGGVDLSAQYAVDNAIAPILSLSFGLCEAQLGTSGNSFFNGLWQQGASEGITVSVASGDSGSAGCDPIASVTPPTPQPAKAGLAVNGLASTPYNVAVGGTDFDDYANPGAYWSPTNTQATQQSAFGYIPELVYNDSCTSPLFGTNPEADCNNSTFVGEGAVQTVGSGGGASNCTNGAGGTNTCGGGGYAKPPWQNAPGVPNDGKRDTPDVSLFSGDGGFQGGSFYIVCQQDQTGNAPCSASNTNSFLGFGGTSVAAQTFAGVMALIDQKAGGAQGNPNYVLYALASEEPASSCNSGGAEAAGCIFNDITLGTNAQPCAKGSPNCTVLNGSDTYGVLFANQTQAYNAQAGYDMAAGLGSVNVANLAAAWLANFYLASSNPAVTIPSPGGSGSLNFSANALNGFSGQISFACAGLPSGYACSFNPASVTLGNGTTSASVILTVSGSSGGFAPLALIRRWPRRGALEEILLLAAALLLGLLTLICSRRRALRWGAVFASLALAGAILAGCSGGGSSPGGGGGSGTTATLLAHTGSGNSAVTYGMNFTVTIQ